MIDYFTDRRHRVSIDGISSDWKYESSGVPQGSIIGPILFLIYINDIGSELSPDTLLPPYADDAKYSRIIRSQLDRDILQQDLSTLYQWSETWGMKFNTKKCKHLCITNKRNRLETSCNLGTERIPLSTEEKDLGVLVSHNLSWHNHIMAKVNIANKVLRLIKRTCGNYTQPHVLLKLYIHLVRTHIKFVCQVWSPHQQFLIDAIERVQRRTTKLIIKDRPYGERLQELNLLSLASRRLFMDLVFVFKCMMGLYDLDLSYYLVTADSSKYNLRHANYQFKIRCLKFSYFFKVAKSWNSLPLHLRKIESLNEFKDRLKFFLHLKDISTFS